MILTEIKVNVCQLHYKMFENQMCESLCVCDRWRVKVHMCLSIMCVCMCTCACMCVLFYCSEALFVITSMKALFVFKAASLLTVSKLSVERM